MPGDLFVSGCPCRIRMRLPSSGPPPPCPACGDEVAWNRRREGPEPAPARPPTFTSLDGSGSPPPSTSPLEGLEGRWRLVADDLLEAANLLVRELGAVSAVRPEARRANVAPPTIVLDLTLGGDYAVSVEVPMLDIPQMRGRVLRIRTSLTFLRSDRSIPRPPLLASVRGAQLVLRAAGQDVRFVREGAAPSGRSAGA